MNPRIKIESLREASLLRKFSISFVFMSLVPIVLLVFIIYILRLAPALETELPYFNLTLVLVVLLSLASFDLVRRSMKGLVSFAQKARDISAGNFSTRVDTGEKDEIGLLAESFNKITSELEQKISELEESKRLLQDILQKVGTAVISTKGMDNLFQLIIQSLVKGVNATSGAILLLDESQRQLNMKVSFGMNIDRLNIKAEEGLIGRVVRFKRPEMAADVSRNAIAYFEFKNGLAKDSIIAAPLLYKEKLLGVITLNDKKGKASFNNDDIVLIGNVAAQTAIAIANFQLNEDAEKTYLETIAALAVAVEAKDPYSRGHLDRVGDYVDKLATQMSLDDEMRRVLKHGAILHDIGKIGIRDEILRKEGPLTKGEEDEMKEHVLIGINIIRPIRSMSALCELVGYHQEWYDGSGYPEGLKGEEIPLTARILKVADAYDAMTTDRPYRKAISREEAIEELKRRSGTEFDPKVVEEFLKII